MKKKNVEYYQIAENNWHRIHFVRPRFKGNIENVLLYMANECCRIPACTCKEYRERYFNAIKMFPGNIDKTNKALNNWRTEIPALFGFYNENKELNRTETSPMAWFLYENQDLTQFMKLFLYSFQFPGGHMKAYDLKDIIQHNIRFKPAKTIIQVLMAGNELLSKEDSSKEMSISAEEATYCIFNDIRVTSGHVAPQQVAETILLNRKKHIKYYNKKDPKIFNSKGKPRSKGDVIRYAGDILDYMELANLLESHNGYFTLNGVEHAALDTFANDITFFVGYDSFYRKKEIEVSSLNAIESSWFEYVNRAMKPDMFKTDIRLILKNEDDIDFVLDNRIKDIVTSDGTTTKDIGNLGEAIICGHEKMRLKISGYDDFIRLVQIVDSPTHHPGYDIESYEADGTEDLRYIEVKTTISKQRIQMYGFHMSPHEWRVANSIKEHYCVYRLMLSEQDKTLFILRDPVALYKNDKIEAELRDGMEIVFESSSFEPTELLIWKR